MLISVNTSYNELAKQRSTVPVVEDEYPLYEATEMGPGLSLTLEDQKKCIRKALAQIKTEEALVLRLFYLCEMSLKEVEAITAFSASKIRVDLHRGRKNLKLQLRQLLGEETDTLL